MSFVSFNKKIISAVVKFSEERKKLFRCYSNNTILFEMILMVVKIKTCLFKKKKTLERDLISYNYNI